MARGNLAGQVDRVRLRVVLGGAEELALALRAGAAASELVRVPSLAGLPLDAAVDVEVSFTDGESALAFGASVFRCALAPDDESRPFRLDLRVDPASAGAIEAAAVRARVEARRPRRSPRRAVSLLVSVTAGNVSAPGSVEDLSVGGARLVADLGRPLVPGEPVVVEFLDRALRARTRPQRAEVRWVAPGDATCAFGVRFAALDASTREVIAVQVGAPARNAAGA